MTGIQLRAIFDFLDLHGSRRRTAEVAIELENTQSLLVRAGGAKVMSSPAGSPGPYAAVEVLLDHEPPRFWTRYATTDAGVVYAEVPPLLITHHIMRRGGIRTIDYEVKEPLEGVFSLKVAAARETADAVWETVQGITGVTMIGSRFTPGGP